MLAENTPGQRKCTFSTRPNLYKRRDFELSSYFDRLDSKTIDNLTPTLLTKTTFEIEQNNYTMTDK